METSILGTFGSEQLKFDGTFIGEIKDYITSKIYSSNSSYKNETGSIPETKSLENLISNFSGNKFPLERIIVRTLDGAEGSKVPSKVLGNKVPSKFTELNVYRVYKEYPLVLDSIKKLFRIYRTKYHSLTIDGVKYLASKYSNELSIDEFGNQGFLISPSLLNDIRRIFAFNWLMCITSNSDSKIYIRRLEPKVPRASSLEYLKSNIPETKSLEYLKSNIPGNKSFSKIFYPITLDERGYSTDISGCDVSEKILNKWFNGSRELFYHHIKKLIQKLIRDEIFTDFEDLKMKIESIINEINPLLLGWADVIYKRFQSTRYLGTLKNDNFDDNFDDNED